MPLRNYQEKQVNEIARCLYIDNEVCVQLPTGGGKTMEFSAITWRFRNKSDKSVLICVHRIELLTQIRATLWRDYKINSQPIIAGMKVVPIAGVYVGMVESVMPRLKHIQNVGLTIVDECHRGEFDKLLAALKGKKIIGFSATPWRLSKKNPLKNHYKEIVPGCQINELIALNNSSPGEGLCQNVTRIPEIVMSQDGLTVSKSTGDFDVGLMAIAYSKPKYVQNTVDAYKRFAEGTKAMVYNCSIDHSRLVMNAFIAAGYKCMHIDGETPKTERKAIWAWYKHTPGAILCNVDVATTGVDEPTIETIIMNRSTTSMSLWLQCCGRGSRPTPFKSMFTIIDMGSNGVLHGDWNDDRDWYSLFHNPPKPGKNKDNPAPSKVCPECQALVPAQCRICEYCGYVFPGKPQEVETPIENFTVLTKNINVKEVVLKHQNKSKYKSLYIIGEELAKSAKLTLKEMDEETRDFIYGSYLEKIREWCVLNSFAHITQWMFQESGDHLDKELSKSFPKWRMPKTV